MSSTLEAQTLNSKVGIVDITPPRPLRLEDLPRIENWFEDPETERWLGDREWARNLLRLAHEPNRFALLFDHADEPVAILDVELDDESAAIAIVVAPSRRKEGIALRVLQSLFTLPATRHVGRFIGEVEAGNAASDRLLRAAGFEFETRTADGFDRYVFHRARGV